MQPTVGATARLSDGSLLRLSGMGPIQSAKAARALVDEGASALLSWGVCGALAPELKAGSLVMPRTISSADGILRSVDLAWWRRLDRVLQNRSIEYVDGCLLSAQRPIAEIAEKALTWETTAAIAVDTESAAVAEIAAANKVPFLALRVVVDDANQALPKPVMAATDILGRPRAWLMASTVMIHPELWLTIARLNSAYWTAKRTLKEVSRTQPGLLAFGDNRFA